MTYGDAKATVTDLSVRDALRLRNAAIALLQRLQPSAQDLAEAQALITRSRVADHGKNQEAW